MDPTPSQRLLLSPAAAAAIAAIPIPPTHAVVEGCDGPYLDCSSLPAAAATLWMQQQQQSSAWHGLRRKGPRGGVTTPFPLKLYAMLMEMSNSTTTNSMDPWVLPSSLGETVAKGDGDTNAVCCWQPHGRCFIIHQVQAFVNDIMPRFFKQSKFTSFQRQLNLYGFQRVTSGRDRQAYYHPLLLRGRPDLCRLMLRTRVKGGGLLFAGAATTNPSSSCPLSVLLSGELGVPEQKTSQGRSNAKRKQHAISFYDLPQCNTNNNTYIETVSSRASHVSSSDDDDESTDLNGRRLPVVKRSKPNSPIATPIVSESFVAASVHVPCVPDAVAASECNSSMLSTVTPRLMDNNTPNLVRSSSTSSLSSLDGSYPLAPIQSATWELLPNDACSSSSWPETTTPSLHHVIYRSGNRAHSATSHAIYHETTLQSAGEIHGEYSPLGGIGCAFSADAVKNNHGLPSVAPFSNSSNDCSVSCGKSQCFGVFEGQPFLFVDDENLRLYESNVIGECG